MDPNRTTPRPKGLIAAIILLTFALGCLCLPSTVNPSASPTRTRGPDTIASPVPPLPTGALNAEGPWLLMETREGLWAANPDGSGLTQLTDVDYWNGELLDAIQPGGNQIVFITPGNYDFRHMALSLMTLPDGQVSKITDLTSPETEAYADSSPGGDGFEALRAIGEQRSYAWSPDGTRLAFAGLMDGPSAEIYLYDAMTQQIQRVSDDQAQNYSPSWSPDGNHLLYLGAEGFGTGAGYVMSGVWSAWGDGSNVTLLYEPDSGAEELIGWLDETTAVLDSWKMDCGSQDLRLYDVVTRQTAMLNAGCFTSAAADGLRGAAIFTSDSGLYVLTAEDRTPVRVSQDPVAWIDTVEPHDYVFSVHFEDGGIATYGTSDMDHLASPVDAPTGAMDVAMYGLIWGWTSDDDAQPGAWISGPGVEIGQIFSDKARLPIWDPDNNLLFFALDAGYGYNIYRTTFDVFYRDLTMVAHIEAEILHVAWLGAP